MRAARPGGIGMRSPRHTSDRRQAIFSLWGRFGGWMLSFLRDPAWWQVMLAVPTLAAVAVTAWVELSRRNDERRETEPEAELFISSSKTSGWYSCKLFVKNFAPTRLIVDRIVIASPPGAELVPRAISEVGRTQPSIEERPRAKQLPLRITLASKGTKPPRDARLPLFGQYDESSTEFQLYAPKCRPGTSVKLWLYVTTKRRLERNRRLVIRRDLPAPDERS